MQDPDFKREYEALESEYEAIRRHILSCSHQASGDVEEKNGPRHKNRFASQDRPL